MWDLTLDLTSLTILKKTWGVDVLRFPLHVSSLGPGQFEGNFRIQKGKRSGRFSLKAAQCIFGLRQSK